MNKALWCRLLIWIGLGLGALPAHAQTTYDRQDLENAGIRQLNQLYDLWGHEQLSSIDQYFGQAALAGGTGFNTLKLQVVIDGQRYEVQELGNVNLNRLPVNVGQIDSMKLMQRPAVVEGQWVEPSTLLIYTRPQQEGLSANARFRVGNKSGDPGPFVYTDRGTPNLDRRGPEALLSLGHAGRSWFAEAFVRALEHHVSDPIQRSRINRVWEPEIQYDHPVARLNGGALRAGYRSDVMKHQLQFSANDALSFPYLKPFGQEVPVTAADQRLGLAGNVKLWEGLRLRYSGSHTRFELSDEPNRRELEFDWNERQTRAELGLTGGGPVWQWDLGGRLERRRLRSNSAPSTLQSTVANAFGQLRGRPAVRLHLTGALGMSTSAGNVAWTPVLSARFETEAGTFDASASYHQQLWPEQDSFWYWIGEGHGLLQTLNLPYRFEKVGPKRSIAGIHLKWRRPVSEAWQLQADLGVSRFRDDVVDLYTFANEGSVIISDSTVVRGEMDYSQWSGRLRLRHNPNSQFGYTVELGLLRLTALDEPMRELSQRIPGLLLSYRAGWRPVPQLLLWTRWHYRPSSEWTEFRSLNGKELPGFYRRTHVSYSSVLDARLTGDLGVEQQLWKQRIALEAGLYNLLNRPYRSHPLAPVQRMTLFISARLSF